MILFLAIISLLVITGALSAWGRSVAEGLGSGVGAWEHGPGPLPEAPLAWGFVRLAMTGAVALGVPVQLIGLLGLPMLAMGNLALGLFLLGLLGAGLALISGASSVGDGLARRTGGVRSGLLWITIGCTALTAVTATAVPHLVAQARAAEWSGSEWGLLGLALAPLALGMLAGGTLAGYRDAIRAFDGAPRDGGAPPP